jgi:hypothetical protein
MENAREATLLFVYSHMASLARLVFAQARCLACLALVLGIRHVTCAHSRVDMEDDDLDCRSHNYMNCMQLDSGAHGRQLCEVLLHFPSTPTSRQFGCRLAKMDSVFDNSQ